MTSKFALAGLFITACILLVAAFVMTTRQVSGSAPSGLAATVATTSYMAVSTTEGRIFATTTGQNCAARIITTYAQPIMLTFSEYDSKVPSGNFGHLQAASTTVVYDGGVYGCNAVRAYAFGTVNITVTETR